MTTTPSRFPAFKPEVLSAFQRELKAAGSLDDFMISKKAIRKWDYSFSILTYDDLDLYANTYLNGPYESARPVLKELKLPYDFWLQVYWVLLYKQARDD